MQIRKLVIDNHKCLVDFGVNFTVKDGGSSTILIGENGTGKSTMLETILEILTSFDSPAIEKQIDYGYELEYLFAGRIIQIYHSDKLYKIDVNHQNLCVGTMSTIRSCLKDSNTSIFPERITYFYSGVNNKAKDSSKRVLSLHRKACREALTQYWNTIHLANAEYTSQLPKQKYNFCTEEFVPVYLVAILAGEESFEKSYLQNQCHMDRVESISISLNVKKILGYLGEDILQGGVDSVLEILSFLDDRFTALFQEGYLYDDGEKFYFEINNIYDAYADQIAIYELLEKLQTLFEAEIEVYISFGESRVKSSELSEGQRQLIKVLGMLGVCKSEDTLVLMDEPDAHMNPKWKYDLKRTIDQSLQEATNTQAIIATHDPLVINGVEKEFIRIFMYNRDIIRNNNWYFTKALEPEEDTAGMGIDGILQSEYYGLNSTLDAETQSKMEEKRNLLVKRKEGTISPEEQEKLQLLTEEIENLTFSRNIPTDDLYDEFVVAMHKLQQENPISELTPEQIRERNRKAHEIIQGLMEK